MKTNDEILWHIAKRRASFKKQLVTYLLVNAMFWAIWFISGTRNNTYNSIPWPAWVSFWWGIGLAFAFANAYIVNTKESIQNEYEKLKKQSNQ